MGLNFRQRVDLKFASVKVGFTNEILRRASEFAGAEAVKIIIERTGDGIDLNGRRFQRYNRQYQFHKFNQIKGRVRGKGRKKMSGRYAAKRTRDIARLTGELFRSMSVRPIRTRTSSGGFGQIETGFELYFDGSRNKKVGSYLNDGGAGRSRKKYPFFGLSKGGARRKAEDLRIKRAFANYLRIGLRGRNIRVNQTTRT